MSETPQQNSHDGAFKAIFLQFSLWKDLQQTNSLNDFLDAWLTLQSCQICNISHSIAIINEGPDERESIISYWPDETTTAVPALQTACEIAVTERRIVIVDGKRSVDQDNRQANIFHVSVPFYQQNESVGAVAIELVNVNESNINLAIRHLQWGVKWIDVFLRGSNKFKSIANEQLSIVLQLLTCALDNTRLQAATTQITTELSNALGCERVSLGFNKGNKIEIIAISNTAQINKKSNVVAQIKSAMEEAVDQSSTLIYPAAENEQDFKTVYVHSKLAEEFKSALCTVPLVHNGCIVGALFLQRPEDLIFDSETVELTEIIATLIGPILDLKRKDEEWLLVKLFNSVKSGVFKLLGKGYVTQKLITILILLVIGFFSFAESLYRVSADAKLEGLIHRVVVAPFDGYINESFVRSGDRVKTEQVLAKLDDRDLIIERLNWQGKRNQYSEQYRDALAELNPAEVKVLKTKLGQTKAELKLLDEMLKRTSIAAPFDGFVVSGDLTQLMGAPIAKGDVLFEIAPLDAYRIILEVDERDIGEISIGQKGELLLTGKSDVTLPFQVKKLTPVAEQKEGRNYFRVEALLENTPPVLRPGMKGVGKIEIEDRKIFWIWTHHFLNWVRLWLWSWWP